MIMEKHDSIDRINDMMVKVDLELDKFRYSANDWRVIKDLVSGRISPAKAKQYVKDGDFKGVNID